MFKFCFYSSVKFDLGYFWFSGCRSGFSAIICKVEIVDEASAQVAHLRSSEESQFIDIIVHGLLYLRNRGVRLLRKHAVLRNPEA
jgi:hypothetical protein